MVSGSYCPKAPSKRCRQLPCRSRPGLPRKCDRWLAMHGSTPGRTTPGRTSQKSTEARWTASWELQRTTVRNRSFEIPKPCSRYRACEEISMKKALITGITGQDGSYLAGVLPSKGYEVHGIVRRASTFNTARINHIYKDLHMKGTKLFLHYGDLSDSEQISNLVYNIEPQEKYKPHGGEHVGGMDSAPAAVTHTQ